MIIETQFDVGEELYFLFNNKITIDTIYSIDIQKYSDGSGGITYILNSFYQGNRLNVKEAKNNLFKTKQELLDSL